MDINLHTFGNELNSFVEQNRPIQAEEFISQTNKAFTENEISSFTIDAYILNIFNKTNGVLIFLTGILHKPEYKKAKLKCFELLYTLVNNCTNKVQNYLIDIINACSPVVRSSVTAAEKQKSLQLITLIIKKIDICAGGDGDVEAELNNLYSGTLFKCLHHRFDKSNIVQEELLVAVGELTKKFPSVVINPLELRNSLIAHLNGELNRSVKSYPVITGSVIALSNFLENFPFDPDDDKVVADTIYRCLKLLADPGDATRRVAFRESLSFVTKHIVLLSKALYSALKWWHTTLLKWFTLGPQDKKAAYGVLDAFHREMANVLSNRNEQSDHERFKYFMDYFIETISKPSVDNYEMKLAIRGYGFLACSFRTHIAPEEINKTFITISQIMEHTYVLNLELNEDQISYLPHYIQTLSFIINNLPQLHSSHIACLQRICILMIKIFPKISHTEHFLVVDAFVLTMYQLLQCRGNVLEMFLEDTVHQGVLWTCSHRIALDAELYKDQDHQIITYKNYLPLWDGLLSIMSAMKYEKYDITLKIRKLIATKLLDELIKTLFSFINKLNLNTKPKDIDLPITDPGTAYQAVQANDFVVFVNIVDFYRDVIEAVNQEMFEIWIDRFINQVIVKSLKHPLVSGFYKLLAACLKVSDKLNYFERLNPSATDDVAVSYDSVCKFLQEILWRMKQYKGDLQVACMQVLLAAPICTIKDLLPSAAPAFIALFSVGRSYLQLASLGIDTLERWLKHIPQEDYTPFIKQVLPTLDSYLKSRSLGGNVVSNQTIKNRKTKLAVSKRKILIETEPELLKLQIKILTFIGQLDNDDLYLAFVSSGNNIEPVVWNKTPFLKISLPYSDAKLNLYLDKFVPRTVELALYSSDRKIRVAASELLHAIIIIILGTSHPMDPTQLKEFDRLIKAVSTPILKLGCDMDQVIQQLFSALAIQMMHYYSHPRQMYSSHTQIVVEALIEAIANPSDSALRDFAGNCIKEFVSWTIKQADEDDLKKNPINIKLWIRTMYSFSLHPDPFKRLGAALIFNHIYTILREETHMFNMFWLEILYAFVVNLSLLQVNNMDDNNCVDQVYQALNHVQRGFVEKHAVFNKSDAIRRKPTGFEGILLKDVAVWLLQHTGSINWFCRQKCMSMFCKIAPLVENCKNDLQEFKRLYIVNDADWISNTYESELLKNPTLNTLQSTEGIGDLFKWLQGLLCALDGYIFVINNNLIPIPTTEKKSTFFESLQFFLQSIQLQGLNEVLSLIPDCGATKIYSAFEKENFNTLKSSIVTKIIEFATTVLENKVNLMNITQSPQLLWEYNLWNLICHRIFYATTLGFDTTSDDRWDEILNLLNLINDYCAPSEVNSLINAIATYIINTLATNTSPELNITSIKQRNLIKGMLVLQRSVLAEKLNILKYVEGTIKTLMSELSESKNGKKILVKLHNNALTYWELRLDVVLKDIKQFDSLIVFIGNPTKVTQPDQNEEIEYGAYFFERFKNVILKYIINNYETFLEKIYKHASMDKAFKYVMEVLRYIQQNPKILDQSTLQNTVLVSIQNMENMLPYFDSNAVQKLLGIEFLGELACISIGPLHNFTQDKPAIARWLISLIAFEDLQWNSEASLNFKREVFKVLASVVGPTDEFEQELQDALETLKQKYFTVAPSSVNISLITLFYSLLDAVKDSKSKILLRFAADIYATVPFISKDVDLNLILNSILRCSSVEHQLNTLNIIHSMCFDVDTFTPTQRYLLAKDVLSVLLRSCYYSTFEQFFISVINSILSCLNGESDPAVFNMTQIMNKIIAYICIEILFSRIKTDAIENNSCPITRAAFEQSDKKLVKEVTLYALKVCKELYNLNTQEEKDMFRLYQCQCYNAFTSVISNTQKDIKYYNWLFSREEKKQDILWNNLVDTDKKYYFAIAFDEVPTTRKILVNIRRDLLIAKKNIDPEAHTVKYIESQYLFKSTLSEDVTRYDFNHSILRDEIKGSEDIDENITEGGEFNIKLEAIDINNHECMATICALIQHMCENDISPLPVDNENVVLPKWMKAIRTVMMNEATHDNVKLFLAKVIHNTQHYFKPYAKWFLGPIVKVVVDECAGNTINFFITDLLMMLTQWSSVVIPVDDQALASAFLSFLMKNADSDRRAIFKYNLEQIKLVLEVWKPCLTIPYDLLFQKLQLEATSPKLDVGVHLVATVLANNKAPWQPDQVQTFLMTLTKILKSTHRTVYQPCAEVLGMSLKYMSADSDCSQHIKSFQNYLHKQLEKFIEDGDKFAYCLQGLVLHYPVMANPFLCRMMSKLIHIHGNFKCMYLNIFLARIEVLHEMNELSSLPFQSLLVDENFEIQLLTLEIIKKSVEYLNNNQLISVLRDVSKFLNSSSVICRTAMYDIIMNSYMIHCTQENDASKDVIEICKDVLLQGLVDKESVLQEKAIAFWSNVNNLPVDIANRFLYLLKDMYKANIEEHYVSYSTYLLLNVLNSSEEFNEKLFEYALHECNFEDFQLSGNWRRQHATIAPLFADTLMSQDSTQGFMKLNVLRSSVSTLEFQPTQAGTSTATSGYSYSANIGSLLFNTNAEEEVQDGVFKNPNYALAANRDNQSRRFLKDQSKISRHCAYLESKKSLKMEELRKDKIKQSEGNVTISRKYRIGDYPDIEITLSAVIIPLQMLARCDAVLARCLYVSLFTSLFDKKGKDGKQDDHYIENIKQSIHNIFNSSTQFIPNTIGTFLDIALTFKTALQFDASTITNVCNFSGLYSVGSLLLEEYLVTQDQEYVAPSKKRRGVESESTIHWVKFAALYKEMDEWDVVSAVFLEKMNCSEMVLSAIEAESCGNWRSAQEFYTNVIAEDSSEDRKDFYYESYFNCFAALAEWEDMSKEIEETVKTDSSSNVWTSLWDDDWNQQNLLPWFITAELRKTLYGLDSKLFVYVNESLTDVEKYAYLKLNFGEELTMLWLLEHNCETATYYLNSSISNFLENWSHLNPLFDKLRINKILNLRNMVDIYLFLNAIKSINSGSDTNIVDSLLKSWQETSKDSMESLILNETRTVYRNQFLSTLRTKLQSVLKGEDIEDKNKRMRDCKFRLHLNLVESALDQGNYYVARKYFKRCPTRDTENQVEDMQWFLAYSKILFLKANILDESKEKLSLIMESWSKINKLNNVSDTEDNSMCYLIKTKEHVFRLTLEVFKIVSKNEILFNENEQKIKKLMGSWPLENSEAVWRYGITTLRDSLNFCENEIQLMMNNDNLKVYTYMGDAYIKLAYSTQNKEQFDGDFISCVLKAIKHGSAEGKQLFPCLLNKDIGVTFKDVFVTETSQIPIWMFLGWLPQLLANVDTTCVFGISEILLQIAKQYPQAIMYAYRLSKEKYKFKTDAVGMHAKELTNRLDELLLQNQLIDKFLSCVSSVVSPTIVLRYHLRKLMHVTKSKDEFKKILQNLIDEVYFEAPDYKNPNNTQGAMFKEIKKYEAKIKALSKEKANTLENSVKSLKREIDNLKYKISTKLADYSPWLANFQATNLHASLEIPGQYTGETRPLPQYHIKIMGFSQNVQTLESIRAPIRITILGNDAKEYQYLVKYGEDLRQDQRIEQIFNLMNNILSHDSNCHKRQLSISTYQVIPLKSCLGIIEWINNTTELKEFIQSGFKDQSEKLKFNKSTPGEYYTWIAKATSRNRNPTNATLYGNACKKYSRDNVICKYTSLVNSISMDVLRKSFWNISVNSESFFTLRHKFAVSYAVLCISHWLLGIGDRHLSNCLVSLHTGQAIGIDFGHAFGTATQLLEVPELVPFRLTPHILYLLQPLAEKGILQETMIHCLKAFRKNSDILLATMSVFIKEPSLDWLEYSRRSELNSDSTGQNWYPAQKMLHAEQKLQGINPINITIEELKAGSSNKAEFLDVYVNLVRGKPEWNFRARKEGELSEEDQVKCLLDQSTDYNLLGRMWQGWYPWI